MNCHPMQRHGRRERQLVGRRAARRGEGSTTNHSRPEARQRPLSPTVAQNLRVKEKSTQTAVRPLLHCAGETVGRSTMGKFARRQPSKDAAGRGAGSCWLRQPIGIFSHSFPTDLRSLLSGRFPLGCKGFSIDAVFVTIRVRNAITIFAEDKY